MKAKTTAQVNCINTRAEASAPQPTPTSWEAFPKPKSWAVAWDSRGLTHDVQSTRGRASARLTDQE